MSVELHAKLEKLHSADIAAILEGLPTDDRLTVWNLVRADREGEILLELSDAVRESLIATMDSTELVAAAETLDADQIADLVPDLPEQVVQDVIRALPQEEREQLRAALSYREGTVCALMDFEQAIVREDATLEAATRTLRGLDELPAHTDQLFVVDREGRLRGTLPLARLIVTDLERAITAPRSPTRCGHHNKRCFRRRRAAFADRQCDREASDRAARDPGDLPVAPTAPQSPTRCGHHNKKCFCRRRTAFADTEAPAREKLTGWGENSREVANIPVHGGTVTVSGSAVKAGQRVAALGAPVPVDAAGRFATRQVLSGPAGHQSRACGKYLRPPP